MLTKTTLSAVRTLMYLGAAAPGAIASPRVMGQQLGESPTYLAKVTRLLVKAGILRAQRGVAGGVQLNRSPEDIRLLDVVEACQGAILGDFCHQTSDLSGACAFHLAGAELHEAIIGVLARWTLADFLRNPPASDGHLNAPGCWLAPCPVRAATVWQSGEGGSGDGNASSANMVAVEDVRAEPSNAGAAAPRRRRTSGGKAARGSR
jgi:Rrf2 family transcriptional regulator, nitric oxide-sensitive transcriptional repressor